MKKRGKQAMRIWVTLFGLLIGAVVMTAPVMAAPTTSCRVLTVEASSGPGGVDARLAQFAELFVKKPFNRFSSFKLVDEKKVKLTLGGTSSLALPHQMHGALTFIGEQHRQLKLTLALERPGGDKLVVNGVASRGIPFITAGLKSDKGRWIIVVKCD